MLSRISKLSVRSVGVGLGLGLLSTMSLSHCAKRPPITQKMNIKDKVVLVTGATSGIGEACAWRFAEEGCKIVLVGRREDKLDEIKQLMLSEFPSLSVLTVPMSICDLDAVAKLPTSLPSEFQNVSILVNNAGLALGVSSAEDNNMDDVLTVMNTNAIGLIAMCTAFLPGMKARGEGHLINMGSIAGHRAYATGSAYNASKYAVVGYTDATRHDLAGTPIRVTHISPGMVGNTEFSNVRLKDDAKASAVYSNIEALRPEDVADNVIYAATRPSHVQIADIVMFCTNQSGPRDIVRAGPSLGKSN